MAFIASAAIAVLSVLTAFDGIGGAHAFVAGGAQLARGKVYSTNHPAAAAAAAAAAVAESKRRDSRLAFAPSSLLFPSPTSPTRLYFEEEPGDDKDSDDEVSKDSDDETAADDPPPAVEFTLMWEVFKQQLFYARFAYCYDYYLRAANRDAQEMLDKSVAKILELTQPDIQKELDQLLALTKKEKKALDGLQKTIFDNKDYLDYLLSMPLDFPGATRNYLVAFNNDDEETSCVWGAWRDDSAKRIQIFFRGSESSRPTSDWGTNFKAQLSRMPLNKMPLLNDLINENAELNEDSPLTKRGKAIEGPTVHRGFYEYLFENKEVEKEGKDQAIEVLMKLLREIDSKNNNYEVWVCGHSLGGAMATMVAFYLSGQKFDNIRKPIKAVTFSSPLVGCEEFRAAFQTMEKQGLLQHLRVANQEDAITGLSPISLSVPIKLYKHVGINLELYDDKFKYLYPTKEKGEERTNQVSLLRKIPALFGKSWNPFAVVKNGIKHHGEEMISNRMLKLTYGEGDPLSLLNELDKTYFVEGINVAEKGISYDRKNKFIHLTMGDLYRDVDLTGGFPFALKTKEDD